jgi:hypothetical protein
MDLMYGMALLARCHYDTKFMNNKFVCVLVVGWVGVLVDDEYNIQQIQNQSLKCPTKILPLRTSRTSKYFSIATFNLLM